MENVLKEQPQYNIVNQIKEMQGDDKRRKVYMLKTLNCVICGGSILMVFH